MIADLHMWFQQAEQGSSFYTTYGGFKPSTMRTTSHLVSCYHTAEVNVLWSGASSTLRGWLPWCHLPVRGGAEDCPPGFSLFGGDVGAKQSTLINLYQPLSVGICFSPHQAFAPSPQRRGSHGEAPTPSPGLPMESLGKRGEHTWLGGMWKLALCQHVSKSLTPTSIRHSSLYHRDWMGIFVKLKYVHDLHIWSSWRSHSILFQCLLWLFSASGHPPPNRNTLESWDRYVQQRQREKKKRWMDYRVKKGFGPHWRPFLQVHGCQLAWRLSSPLKLYVTMTLMKCYHIITYFYDSNIFMYKLIPSIPLAAPFRSQTHSSRPDFSIPRERFAQITADLKSPRPAGTW